MLASGWLRLALRCLAMLLVVWAAEQLQMSRTALISIFVLCSVIAIILALHQLGEAKDRWVIKLSKMRSVVALVAWGRKGRARLMATVLLIGLVGAAVGFLAFTIVYFAVRNQIVEDDDKDSATVLKDPVIEPSYNTILMGLPIALPPNSTTAIFRIRESRKVEMSEHRNSTDQKHQWPAPVVSPPEAVGLIKLANHGDVPVFNVSYSFRVDIGTQSSPSGIANVRTNLPILDLPLGESREFYIVNQSPEPAMIHLSSTAEMRVQGEHNRRVVKVQPRQVTFFDKIPTLPQSSHKWSGDMILDADQWGVNKKK
jgi:hypothetical protein